MTALHSRCINGRASEIGGGVSRCETACPLGFQAQASKIALTSQSQRRCIAIPRKTDDNVIKRLYEEGRTTTEIARHFNVSNVAISQRYRVLGINVSKRRRTPIYTLNERFFDAYSAGMAYVLGFILTDGCITRNTAMIAQKERETLEGIAKLIGTDAPITATNGVYRLHINRKAVVERLKELGITERKSLTVGCPDVPSEYFADFLRGVIDGDGWAHKKGYVVCIASGSELFAEELTARLNSEGFPFKRSHDGHAWRIKLSGKDEVKRLGEYLYSDPTAFCIARKKARILQTDAMVDAVDVLTLDTDIA